MSPRRLTDAERLERLQRQFDELVTECRRAQDGWQAANEDNTRLRESLAMHRRDHEEATRAASKAIAETSSLKAALRWMAARFYFAGAEGRLPCPGCGKCASNGPHARDCDVYRLVGEGLTAQQEADAAVTPEPSGNGQWSTGVPR